MALLHITDAGGRAWQLPLSPQGVCTIGRAPDNAVVLNDPRASRYHAHIKFQDGQFQIVDGKVGGGRSANHVFVRGEQRYEHTLADGDRVQIGASELRFDTSDEGRQPTPSGVNYDDRPLGQTQLRISTNDVLRSLQPKPITAALVNVPGSDLKALQRKSTILALLYEMSKTLGSVFNLDAIFSKATEVIFSATPADRVVALLRDENLPADAMPEEESDEEGDSLRVVSMRVRDEWREAQAKQQPIGRTVTRKVMRERTALLSHDASGDMHFANVH